MIHVKYFLMNGGSTRLFAALFKLHVIERVEQEPNLSPTIIQYKFAVI